MLNDQASYASCPSNSDGVQGYPALLTRTKRDCQLQAMSNSKNPDPGKGLDHENLYHEAVASYLKSIHQDYSVDTFKSRSTFSYLKETPQGSIRLEIYLKPWLEAFTFYAYAAHRIPEVHQTDLLAAFASANSGHKAIKTEINPETGQVRCGYAMYLVSPLLTPTRLAEMERCCVAMMEALLPTLGQYTQPAE